MCPLSPEVFLFPCQGSTQGFTPHQRLSHPACLSWASEGSGSGNRCISMKKDYALLDLGRLGFLKPFHVPTLMGTRRDRSETLHLNTAVRSGWKTLGRGADCIKGWTCLHLSGQLSSPQQILEPEPPHLPTSQMNSNPDFYVKSFHF